MLFLRANCEDDGRYRVNVATFLKFSAKNKDAVNLELKACLLVAGLERAWGA